MSEFKMGDKVVVSFVEGLPLHSRARYAGKTGTVIGLGGVFGYHVDFDEAGLTAYPFRGSELSPTTPSAEDFEAKYDALVADLVGIYEAEGTVEGTARAYNRYVQDNLLPKPKQYDVTVRVPEVVASGLGHGAGLTNKFATYPVVSVTEVTE